MFPGATAVSYPQSDSFLETCPPPANFSIESPHEMTASSKSADNIRSPGPRKTTSRAFCPREFSRSDRPIRLRRHCDKSATSSPNATASFLCRDIVAFTAWPLGRCRNTKMAPDQLVRKNAREPFGSRAASSWSRGQDLNLRPPGYEPDYLQKQSVRSVNKSSPFKSPTRQNCIKSGNPVSTHPTVHIVCSRKIVGK